MDQGPYKGSFDDQDARRVPEVQSQLSTDEEDIGIVPGVSLDEDAPSDHRLPVPPERTLKEKLVERERQKRIETERARLMRQFALANDGARDDEGLEESMKEDGSVIGTVGGGSSIAAAASDTHDDNQAERLGYVMERFLSENGQVLGNGGDLETTPQTDHGGVVMERFLAEPVVVSGILSTTTDEQRPGHQGTQNPSETISSERHRSSEFVSLQNLNIAQSQSEDGVQVEVQGSDKNNAASLSIAGEVCHHLTPNDSMTGGPHRIEGIAALSDLDQFSDQNMTLVGGGRQLHGSLRQGESSSVSSLHSVDPLSRVVRLTEQGIQEMEAIEEASIGNAPPSEREDTLSEVGDLVGFFPDPTARPLEVHGSFSINTHTTASVSNTSLGGNQSGGGHSQGNDHADAISIDGMATASVSSHLDLSPGGSEDGASVTANPPSIATDNDGVDEIITPTRCSPHPPLEQIISDDTLPHIPDLNHHDLPLDAEESARVNAGVINRRLRPGVEPSPNGGLPKIGSPERTAMKRASSMPEKMHISVDGFDYDKYDFILATPRSFGDSSFQDLPGESHWTHEDVTMKVSPVHPRNVAQSKEFFGQDVESGSVRKDVNSPVLRPMYGAVGNEQESSGSLGFCKSPVPIDDFEYSDRAPLLDPVAPSRRSIAESVFSSLRSESENSIQQEANDAHRYKMSNTMVRAFPERFMALIVTLIVEIPVLFMISGGSDRLCSLIGRYRYQLLMAFLPLSSAISGNCGLQASTLTTRAISHEDVTVENFMDWLKAEVGAATYLALGMGIVLGTFGFVLSGFDVSFGFTIFIAQFISLVTAGFSGTMAPLIFTYIFHRDSGKWGGPLETAIQDIVGSFAMVVISYHVLLFLGPHQIAPTDLCGEQDL